MAEPLTRDRPIHKGRASLLIIDVQNGTFGPAQAESKPEFHMLASTRVIPNIRRLLEAFRGARLEAIYTVIENLTEDGRDTWEEVFDRPPTLKQLLARVGPKAFVVSVGLRARAASARGDALRYAAE